MRFYEITLHSGPTHIFAFNHETNNYRLSFEKHKGQIEICYFSEGSAIMESDSVGKLTIPSSCIKPMTYNEDTLMHSDSPIVKLSTFSVYADYTLREITAEEIFSLRENADKSTVDYSISAILPEIVTDKYYVDKINTKIQRIIFEHSSVSRYGSMKTMKYVYDVFSDLTDFSMEYSAKALSGNTYVDYSYVKKAIYIINQNIRTPMSVSEIAAYIGISVGHLSRVFKQTTNYSMLEYINRTKIKLAAQLFETKNASVKDAALQVGVADEKYFSRLFKKYTEMTVSEYKKSTKVIFP